MSLANKTYKNNKTGEIIKVIDSFENLAILENKQKISVSDLNNSTLFTEQIDPSNFFNNQSAYNLLADKIKNIPTEMIKDEDGSVPVATTNFYDDKFRPATNESAIVYGNEDDEKQELIRKYGATTDSQNEIDKQAQAFQKILGEEEPINNIQPITGSGVSQLRNTIPTQPQIKSETPEDPIISMFKRAKRTIEFVTEVQITNKLPRLDFIEMMEDSYDVSMIDYLADEFTNQIVSNPQMIRNTIKSKIEELVYNKTGASVLAVENNSQITDAVTQFEKPESISFEKEPVLSKDLPKKTTTRKPRNKKESIEK